MTSIATESTAAEAPLPPVVNVESFLPTLEASLDMIDPKDGGALLKAARIWLEGHQQALQRRFLLSNDGEAVVYDRCRLIDALITGLLELATKKLFRLSNPTAGERLTVMAVGGYGRRSSLPTRMWISFSFTPTKSRRIPKRWWSFCSTSFGTSV